MSGLRISPKGNVVALAPQPCSVDTLGATAGLSSSAGSTVGQANRGTRHFRSVATLAATLFYLGVSSYDPLGSALGAPPAASAAKPSEVAGPTPPLVRHVSLKEYEATMRYWAQRYSRWADVEVRGRSRENLPIYLVKITDKSVPDNDKQVCLITALHSGNERSGGNTVLHLAEWLLGDSSEAAEIRRKQVVLLMPICNPYGFFVKEAAGNSQQIDPYSAARGKLWDMTTLKFTQPEKCPEIMALVSVIDEYRPEVHLDSHGTSERYAGQTMFEITGSAYSNYTLRPWDWRVTETMIAAGREAGFGSDRFEADAQRIFWGPDMDPHNERLWPGRPLFYTAHYGYMKCHTMIMAMEVGWEQSGVERIRGLLRIGNRIWEGDRVAGYPVNRLKGYVGHFIEAWGTDAAQRRRSRVELWQNQGGFLPAILYPQTDGRDSFVVALTPAARKLLVSDKKKFLANLQSLPGFDTAAIEAFVRAGPEWRLAVDEDNPTRLIAPEPLQHGIVLRLRLPYLKPEQLDLRLNGHRLGEGDTDGYRRWTADGWTQIQIHVPPEKVRKTDLLVATCAYRPDVARTNGWQPPRQVLDRLEKAGETDRAQDHLPK